MFEHTSGHATLHSQAIAQRTSRHARPGPAAQLYDRSKTQAAAVQRAEKSGTDPRSKEQMEQDVQAAKQEVQQLVNASKTTGQVEAQFPAIQAKYGLKHIGFNEKGEIDIEINPKAKINSSNKLISSGSQPWGDWTTKVKFTTGSLGGDTVGKKMEADPIGPNHPQGSPPASSSQKTLMGKLTTTRGNSAQDKYIRGHLLNDNVGGPGVAKNLYPITASANKKHHDDVEHKVKEWVNDYGYWVYYRVEVKSESYKLNKGKSKNYVNADFECEAYPLTADGDKADEEISYTIRSRKGHIKSSTGSGYEIDMDEDSPEVDSNFGNYSPELSTSKKKLTEIDSDLMENIRWIFEEAPDALKELTEIKGIGEKTYEALLKYLKHSNTLPQRFITALGNKAAQIYAKVLEIYDETIAD